MERRVLSSSQGKRVLLIQPSAYDAAGRVVRVRKSFFPSRTLPYLAAYFPSSFEVRLLDDAVQTVSGDEEADLVVLTGMLPNMARAMDLGSRFRTRGIRTIIGGIGVYSLFDRVCASGAFDSVVRFEAESVWHGIIDDYQAGRLQPVYEGDRKEDLSGLPLARYDLVDPRRYWRLPGNSKPFYVVETSRGCPHSCSFCSVRLYFGQKVRFRPVGDVIDEIRRLGASYYIFADDNLMADPERARELFAALKPLRIRWGGQFDVNAVRHPDVLRLAAEAGCRYAGVGIESITAENFEYTNKRQNLHVRVEDVVGGFRSAGIAVAASMIFGMDADTEESLDETVRRIIECRTDYLLPWVLTPGPGSQVYDELKKQGRLLHENYSLYNGVDVVHRPLRMTPEQLNACLFRALHRFYRLRHAVPRALSAAHKADVLGMGLFFWAVTRSGRHPFSGM
jgi:radical SAM superfamily enzyme YgiQ (UPF0313 family)